MILNRINMKFKKKLFSLLTKKEKQILLWLVLFSIIISFIETIGISAIMPFMQIATKPEVILTNQYTQYLYSVLNFENTQQFIIVFGVFLIVFYILRSYINYLYFSVIAKFAQNSFYNIATRLFKQYLGIPYEKFIQKNSSILSKSIITEAQLLTTIIIALLMILSEIFVLFLIYTLLIFIDSHITLYLTIFLIINALFIIKMISPKIKEAGAERARYQEEFYEIINKSFGNYKMIKLHNLQKNIYDEFRNSSFNFTKANIKNQSLSNVPRLFLEAVAFSIIIGIVVYLITTQGQQNDVSYILAKITIFILALYRLMPSLNRIMTAYNQILFNYKALDIVYENMQFQNEKIGLEKIDFTTKIELKNISFHYQNNESVLENINLKIYKNENIAVIGESGSGKSTLIDILIGLLLPQEGEVIIDNNLLVKDNMVSWRDKIGYIPQSPYLFDGTVGENISFGMKYDKNRVIEVLKQAQIYSFFNSREGLDTNLGENGMALSGGQKQRIAIARALYKEPEILVLDEATSALDYDTEVKIMQEIYSICENKTLIIIAHRLTTINGCDKIIKIVEGCLTIEELK